MKPISRRIKRLGTHFMTSMQKFQPKCRRHENAASKGAYILPGRPGPCHSFHEKTRCKSLSDDGRSPSFDIAIGNTPLKSRSTVLSPFVVQRKSLNFAHVWPLIGKVGRSDQHCSRTWGKTFRLWRNRQIAIKLIAWKAKVQSAVLEGALERTPMTTWKSTYVKDKLLPTDDVETFACG